MKEEKQTEWSLRCTKCDNTGKIECDVLENGDHLWTVSGFVGESLQIARNAVTDQPDQAIGKIKPVCDVCDSRCVLQD